MSVSSIDFYQDPKTGQIIAVNAESEQHFRLPIGSGYGESAESRKIIAENFSSAPLVEKGAKMGVDFPDSTLIESVVVAQDARDIERHYDDDEPLLTI